jgi:hypothetical protein
MDLFRRFVLGVEADPIAVAAVRALWYVVAPGIGGTITWRVTHSPEATGALMVAAGAVGRVLIEGVLLDKAVKKQTNRRRPPEYAAAPQAHRRRDPFGH